MTNKEVLEILSFTSKRYNYIVPGRADGKSKHIEALKTVKERLERLEKLEKVIEIIKKHFFLENFSDFISINGRLDKADYNINEIDLLKEVFNDDDK